MLCSNVFFKLSHLGWLLVSEKPDQINRFYNDDLKNYWKNKSDKIVSDRRKSDIFDYKIMIFNK